MIEENRSSLPLEGFTMQTSLMQLLKISGSTETRHDSRPPSNNVVMPIETVLQSVQDILDEIDEQDVSWRGTERSEASKCINGVSTGGA